MGAVLLGPVPRGYGLASLALDDYDGGSGGLGFGLGRGGRRPFGAPLRGLERRRRSPPFLPPSLFDFDSHLGKQSRQRLGRGRGGGDCQGLATTTSPSSSRGGRFRSWWRMRTSSTDSKSPF